MSCNVREHLFSELHHDLHRAEIDALHLPEFTRNSIKVAVILVKKVVPVDGYTNFYRNMESRNIDDFYSATKISNCLKLLQSWYKNKIGADIKYNSVSYNETISEVPVLLSKLGFFIYIRYTDAYHGLARFLSRINTCLGMNKEELTTKKIECDNTS